MLKALEMFTRKGIEVPMCFACILSSRASIVWASHCSHSATGGTTARPVHHLLRRDRRPHDEPRLLHGARGQPPAEERAAEPDRRHELFPWPAPPKTNK